MLKYLSSHQLGQELNSYTGHGYPYCKSVLYSLLHHTTKVLLSRGSTPAQRTKLYVCMSYPSLSKPSHPYFSECHYIALRVYYYYARFRSVNQLKSPSFFWSEIVTTIVTSIPLFNIVPYISIHTSITCRSRNI